MALPGNLSTITVTGKYLDFTGSPIAGQVKFTLSQVLIDSAADTIIIPSTVTADLNSSGAFSAVVPITNDPDISPSAFSYLFEEAFIGGSSYTITLTSSLGASVDISDLRANAELGDFTNPVSYDVFQLLVDRVEQEEEDNNGGNVAPYKYRYLNMRYPTYANLASAFATYGAFIELDFSTTFIRNNIFARIENLRDFTATNTELRDTTNTGTVSGNTYTHLVAKRGSYATLASSYATYGASTNASQSWNYAQIGTLITQFGYAVTGTGTLTDPWLGINRSTTGSNYGLLGSSIATYAALASAYATYAGPTGVVFTVTQRHIADIIRNEVNRPNRLMLIGAE
jgi:hypothetical protein